MIGILIFLLKFNIKNVFYENTFNALSSFNTASVSYFIYVNNLTLKKKCVITIPS